MSYFDNDYSDDMYDRYMHTGKVPNISRKRVHASIFHPEDATIR